MAYLNLGDFLGDFWWQTGISKELFSLSYIFQKRFGTCQEPEIPDVFFSRAACFNVGHRLTDLRPKTETAHEKFVTLGRRYHYWAEFPPGGGYSIKFYTMRFHPEIQPLTPLCTIFGRKGTPFVYLLLINGTPFTYLV